MILTRRRLLGAAGSTLLVAGCATPQAAPQRAVALALPGRSAPLRAWLYVPAGQPSGGAWPLVVFLHGSGERGSDLDRVKVHGPPRDAAAGRSFPFVLCSPQLEDGASWNSQQLHALLPALFAVQPFDERRVVATGLSLGGHGVWQWAAAYPHDLAAIVPVCGFADPRDVCRGRQVPVRAYHGAADPVVPLAAQQACIDALRACGGSAEFIVYLGVGHDAWTPAYADPALVPWMMSRRRT